MSRRTNVIIIVVAIALIGIIFVIMISRRAPFISTPSPADTINNVGNFGTATTENLPASVKVVTKEPATQSSLLTVSETFAERFGSFSNDSNFENIQASRSFMTASMQSWADSYIAQNSQADDSRFYGVSTKAIKKEVISLNDSETEAQVLLNTQRAETRGDAAPFVYYQKIILRLVKSGDSWLIDSAEWQ